MIRALLLIVLLSGCATVQPPVFYTPGPISEENKCYIQENTLWCFGATPEEEQDWVDRYTKPALDECEKQSLARHKWAAIADLGSTGAVLLRCATVVEANPLGPLIAVTTAIGYYWQKGEAEKSSRWETNWQENKCPVDEVDVAVTIRYAAAANNTILLFGCL